MPLLRFVCPSTGQMVDTDIDLDAESFATLLRDATTLTCPHCSSAAPLGRRSSVAWRHRVRPRVIAAHRNPTIHQPSRNGLVRFAIGEDHEVACCYRRPG